MAHMFDDIIGASQISSHSAALRPLARESQAAHKAPGGSIAEDWVELSEAAREGHSGQEVLCIRHELVERVRQSIATRNYVTPDKIDATVEQLYQMLLEQ